MKLKKFIKEVSPWASIISLGLAIYWKYYPQNIHILTVTGNHTIPSAELVPFLIIIGLILLVKKK